MGSDKQQNVSPLLRQVRPYWIVFLAGLALFIRYWLLPYSNWDLRIFLLPWYQYISDHGGLLALKDPFYNYSPPYMYLLVLSTLFGKILPPIYAIKSISVIFDFITAIIALKIAGLFLAQEARWIAFALTLLLPTVIINSAYWGQCDSVYIAFLLLSIYFTCKKKYWWSLVFFAIAFSIKAQAVFLAPLIGLLFLKRYLPWYAFFLMPLVYLAMITPSLIIGRPFVDVLATYLNQANTYHSLTMNAPNIYVFIPDRFYGQGVWIGGLVAIIFSIFILWWASRQSNDLDTRSTLIFSFASLLDLPYFLPLMHERYFYPAALVSVLVAINLPRLRLVPFALQATSLASYTFFLLNAEILPLSLPAVINGIVVIMVTVWCYRVFRMPPLNPILGAVHHPGDTMSEGKNILTGSKFW